MITLLGIAEFGEPIRCAREALGSSTTIQVGGLSGQLELPGFPSHIEQGAFLTQSPLMPPPQAAKLRRGGEAIHWGHPIAMPSGMSAVTRALLCFEIDPTSVQSEGAKVHFAFDGWRAAFEDYVELYTKQRAYRAVTVVQDAAGLELLAWDEAGNDIRPKPGSTGSINMVMSDEKTALTLAKLKVILKLTSMGTPLALEYELQLAAYRALRSTDYRKAIIETAVAAEVLLTRACQNALAGMGVRAPKKILEKFRTLGGRVTLADILQVGLPGVDLKAKLVEPRNAVVHQGLAADRATGHAAVAATDQLLSFLQPLPAT